MVAQDKYPLGFDRGGKVAVADVPCEAGEMGRIAATDLEQVLVGRDDLGMASVLEHEHVAIFEHQRLRQIDQDPVAVDERDHLAPEMALILGQNGDIERNLASAVGGDVCCANNFRGSQHASASISGDRIEQTQDPPMLDHARGVGQPPRRGEADHHNHGDADMWEELRAGEFLHGRHDQGLPVIGVRGFPMPQA